MKKKKLSRKEAYDRKIASEGCMVLIGHRGINGNAAKLKPHVAAYFRKSGQYVDTADVEGKDTGLLDYNDAMHLRSIGTLVFDEEIDPATIPPGVKLEEPDGRKRKTTR